jgi:hypothetical protein
MALKRICDECGADAKPHYNIKVRGNNYRVIVQKVDLKKEEDPDADLCISCLSHNISKLDDTPRECTCDCHR